MMTNEDRAIYGVQAIDAGTPDRGLNDEETDCYDAICNMLHYCRNLGIDVDRVLEMARFHFDAEVEEEM